MWDLIVSVPDRCLSFYFVQFVKNRRVYSPSNKISENGEHVFVCRCLTQLHICNPTAYSISLVVKSFNFIHGRLVC